MLRVLYSCVLLLFLCTAGKGEVRGGLLWVEGGSLFPGEDWARGARGGEAVSSTSGSFFFLPSLGTRLNKLARRFFVVGDSWFAAFLISCSGVRISSSSFKKRPTECFGSAVRVTEEDSWSASGELVLSSSVEMVEEHSEPTVITDSGRSVKMMDEKMIVMTERCWPTLNFIALG